MRIFFVAIIVCIGLACCKKKTERYEVTRKSLNEAVYASGEMFPANYEYIYPESIGRIMALLVKEGDLVKKGETLALLGNSAQHNELAILVSKLALAKRNAAATSSILSEAEEQVELAKAKYEFDQDKAAKYQELAAENAVPRQQAQDLAQQARASLSEYKKSQEAYESAASNLRGNVLEAERQLAQFRQSSNTRSLRSSMDGMIYSINAKEAELAQPDEPLLLIGTPGRFKLELLVDERDINKLKIGQKVIFETDAYPGKSFSGLVSKIVPVLQKENRSFKVEAAVRDSSRFYPQSSVEANIVVAESRQAIVIPSRFLLTGDTVLISNADEKISKVKVRSGIRNGDWVEISAGLKPGHVVVATDH